MSGDDEQEPDGPQTVESGTKRGCSVVSEAEIAASRFGNAGLNGTKAHGCHLVETLAACTAAKL